MLSSCLSHNGGHHQQSLGIGDPQPFRRDLRRITRLISLLARHRSNLLPNPPDQTFEVIWNNRAVSSSIDPGSGRLIHPTAHLIVRFASDAESGHLLVPRISGLQSRLRARSLREFFSNNVKTVWSGSRGNASDNFYADNNLIAHWANLGYVEEAAIRDHILQSLISRQKLSDHQADALIILFKLAGATFEAYADLSVVGRCLQLLQDHRYYHSCRNNSCYKDRVNSLSTRLLTSSFISPTISMRSQIVFLPHIPPGYQAASAQGPFKNSPAII